MRNETVSKIVSLVKQKNPSADTHMVSLIVLNKMSQIASNMRVKYRYMDGGIIPANMYAMALASSGFGKGKITNLLEDSIINRFQGRFMEYLAPAVSMEKLEELAESKSIKDGTDIGVAQSEVYKEWNKLPKHLYSFSDATIEGVKSKRVKLSMIELGATNMEIDEIALNIEKISDIFSIFLESYDAGKAKQKLIKVDSNMDTAKVPANLFMFGTPSRLLNGSRAESILMDMFYNGYARRLMFGLVGSNSEIEKVSPHDRLSAMRDMSVASDIDDISKSLAKFADKEYIGKILSIEDDVALTILDYQDECETKAEEMKKYQDIEKAEMTHRYWKATKLATIFAFIDDRDDISMNDFLDAKEMCEESGKAFSRIMNRPPSYARLLDFLIDQGRKITHADLVEHLDFYSSCSKAAKEEMIVLATAYAYSNNSVIKRNIVDGIEFISANELEASDGSKTILSISTEITEGYVNKIGEFNNLTNILKSNFKYCSHHFRDGYRDSEHALPKMNLVVLDIDDGTSLQMAMAMMSNYKYIIGTTKRHQAEGYGDRFRMVLPLDRTIELSTDDHSRFMQNIFDWLPFEVDSAAKDIGRKWEGHPDAMIFTNDGDPITSIDFIPDTSKEKAMRNKIADVSNLDGLSRWFALNSSTGNRNHKALRFALMLLDGGLTYEEIIEKVYEMNNSLGDPLPERELESTVFKTVRKKIQEIE